MDYGDNDILMKCADEVVVVRGEGDVGEGE